MKKIFYVMLSCILFCACSDNLDGTLGAENVAKSCNSEIVVEPQGYVNFKSREAFDNYFAQLSEDGNFETRASAVGKIDGFISLKDL